MNLALLRQRIADAIAPPTFVYVQPRGLHSQRHPIPPIPAGNAALVPGSVHYLARPTVGTAWRLRGFNLTPLLYAPAGLLTVMLKRSGEIVDTFEWDSSTTDAVNVPMVHGYEQSLPIFDTHSLTLEIIGGTATVDFSGNGTYL